MKKILAILLSVILGAALFVGCGEKKEEKSSVNQVKDLQEQIKSVYNDSDSYIQPYDNESDRERLDIYIKLKKENKNDKDLSNEYNDICKKILDKVKFSAAKIDKIYGMNFKAVIDDKEVEDANITCEKYTKQKGIYYFDFLGLLTEPKDFKVVTDTPKEITLKSGIFKVGDTISAGRYVCELAGGTGNLIIDDNGTTIINEVLDSSEKTGVKTVTCDLTNGEVIRINDIEKIKFIPVKRKISNKLTTGIWKVGVDIKPGTYIAKAEKGSGNLVVDDNGTQVINQVLDARDENGNNRVTCDLKDGEVIVISSLNEVCFESNK